MAVEDFAGFGVKGYRSYGTSLQNVGPMSKVHLIAGKNNVGKSNLLRALQFILMHVAVSRQPQFNELFRHGRDTPEGWNPVDTRAVAIGIHLNGNLRSLFKIPDNDDTPSLLRLFATDSFSKGHRGVVWFEFDVIPDIANNTTNIVPSKEQFEAGLMQARGMDERWLGDFTLSNFHQAGGAYDNWRTILQQWDVWSLAPKLEWIDAKRSVGASDAVRAGDSVESSFRHGRGFIPQLQTLQSPETENQRRDRPKFDALENLVQSVLEDPQARIAVSASGADLQITTGGKFESYKDLGTGLTEVVQIAAMATSVSGYVISIEEPEIHLHPTLQRLLVTYLAEKTDNHYVISTHSASMLDAEVASISHVSLDEDGWSVVLPVALRRERASVVADLGNRASDLVQSNYVIWVEGPSDRLYVSHWIQQVAPGLLEGANFSIMFYGGGLLNHLTADDDNEVTSFIELAQINRNFAVIIDSDISRRGQTINATKQRVVDELTAASGVSWITSGYTIENYIPDELLKDAIQAAYPNKSYLSPSSQYKSPLGKVFEGETVKPNKVTVARKVVGTGMPTTSWTPHLSDQISKLVEAIKDANGIY